MNPRRPQAGTSVAHEISRKGPCLVEIGDEVQLAGGCAATGDTRAVTAGELRSAEVGELPSTLSIRLSCEDRERRTFSLRAEATNLNRHGAAIQLNRELMGRLDRPRSKQARYPGVRQSSCTGQHHRRIPHLRQRTSRQQRKGQRLRGFARNLRRFEKWYTSDW